MVPDQSLIVAPAATKDLGPLAPLPYRGSGYPVAPHHDALSRYWAILRKHRYTILVSTLIAGALAAIITFRMAPEYQAVSRVAIQSTESDITGLSQKQQVDGGYDPDRSEVEAQRKFLESDSLAIEVIRKLGLASKPADPHAGDRPNDGSRKDFAAEEEALKKFRNSLLVVTIPRAGVLELRYMSTDPQLAARVLNTLMDAYIEQNIRSRFESTTQASSWLGRQLADLQLKVETTQQKLVDYQKNNNIIGFDDKQNITTARLDQLNKELTDAESDRIRKESDYRIAQTGNAELIAQMNSETVTGPAAVLDKLRAQEADLKAQAAQLETRFGPSYPKLVDVKAQLKQVQANIRSTTQNLADRMKNSYVAALSRERLLRASLDKQKQEANLLNQRGIDYNLLKRDAETSRELYEGLLKKLKEAEISAGLQSTNIRVVDQARIPVVPARPRKVLNIAGGTLMGLLFGVLLAVVMSALDSTVRDTQEIESMTGLGTLALIPVSSRIQGSSLPFRKPAKALTAGITDKVGRELDIVSITKPNSQASEAYRALRTSMLLSSVGKQPKLILVTSPLPQEGKTTTSINMAVTFAQRGGRVLLVDCDLRRPSIHKRLRLPSMKGLSTLLTGASSQDVVQPVLSSPNLFFVPAGPHSPRPAELLSSSLMHDYLAEWQSQFDHIILDSPPVLSVTDAVVLSSYVDIVALVVRAGKTPKSALRRAQMLLAQVNAHIAGIIVNAVSTGSAGDYYYYGDYKGYHSYYTEDSV